MNVVFDLLDAWFPMMLVASSGLLTAIGIYQNIKYGPRNPEPLKQDTPEPAALR